MKRHSILSVSLLGCGLLGMVSHAFSAERGAGGSHAFKLTSSAFAFGEPIPLKYTADGADVSPPLKWEGAPAGVKSFVLICEDPDAPVGNWVHWVMYGIPPEVSELPENVEPHPEVMNGIKQGVNDFGRIGYGGPAPPRGKPHRYFFRLYALNSRLDAEAGLSKKAVIRLLAGHVIAEAEWMGTYRR